MPSYPEQGSAPYPVVPISIGAYGGFSSVLSAFLQNQATRDSIRAARRAADVQIAQLDEAAALERQRRSTEAQLVRGRLAVLAADSGFENDGSFAALDQTAYLDERTNLRAINRNLYFQKARVASGLDADFASLASRYVNPLASVLGGAASGYSTGLQIQSLIDSTRRTA